MTLSAPTGEAGHLAPTMRAAMLGAPQRMEVRQVAVPRPGPGQVQIAVEGCGVCGSDLPVWEGRPWFRYPREPGAPGHEGWGRISALGPGADVGGLRVGQQVAALGYRSYAEFDVAAADAVSVLPDELADQPFPGEPLGCAANVVERAGVMTGDTVAVIGTGFLGSAVVGLAVARGARVIAVSRRPTSRRAAAELGAAEQLCPGPDTVARVHELTGGALCDVVIEASGSQQALDLCGPLTRVRGRIAIAGFHQDGPRTVDMQLWNWRGLDVINAHERDPARYRSGMEQAIRAVASGSLDARPLITHRISLERIDEAFDLLAQRPEGFVKAVIVP